MAQKQKRRAVAGRFCLAGGKAESHTRTRKKVAPQARQTRFQRRELNAAATQAKAKAK